MFIVFAGGTLFFFFRPSGIDANSAAIYLLAAEVIIFLVAFFTFKLLVANPIKALMNAFHDIEIGKPTKTLKARSSDEIGTLIREF